MQKTIIPQTTSTIYDIGVRELHRISQDDSARRQADQDLNEARGRDGARLHVTLTALNAMDKRTMEALDAMANDLTRRAAELADSVRHVDETAAKRAEDLVAVTQTLSTSLINLQNALSTQIHEARLALANQADGSLQSLSSQQRENTERLAVDVRKLRDEVVSLVDSRMNQADASFAALRGDVEVVKYLVMDLIKDRIGRNDPKSKSY